MKVVCYRKVGNKIKLDFYNTYGNMCYKENKMSEITIRRSTNGWILTQYNHDHDDVMGPLTTVHEDAGIYADPVANEADSLGDLLYEAFPCLFQAKRQAGMEIVIHSKGQEAEEMEEERDNPEPGFLLPQPATSATKEIT